MRTPPSANMRKTTQDGISESVVSAGRGSATENTAESTDNLCVGHVTSKGSNLNEEIISQKKPPTQSLLCAEV